MTNLVQRRSMDAFMQHISADNLAILFSRLISSERNLTPAEQRLADYVAQEIL